MNNLDGTSYQRTPLGDRAITVYDRVLQTVCSDTEEGIRETHLAVLRELGGGYEAGMHERTKHGIRKKLEEKGLAENYMLTARGNTALEQAEDLFGLVDLALSI